MGTFQSWTIYSLILLYPLTYKVTMPTYSNRPSAGNPIHVQSKVRQPGYFRLSHPCKNSFKYTCTWGGGGTFLAVCLCTSLLLLIAFPLYIYLFFIHLLLRSCSIPSILHQRKNYKLWLSNNLIFM
jgi:hypothetical protein